LGNKLLAAFVLFLVSCSTTKPPESPSISQPLPDASPARGLVVFKPVQTTDIESKLIAEANSKLTDIVRSECFSNFLKDRPMIQTEGRSNKQVIEHLVSLSGVIPMKMYYKRFTSAVAYTVPPDLTIYFNRKYFNKNTSVCDFASTMAHEGYGHALGGYGHDYKYSKARDFSVPYSLNFAIEACCK